MRKILYKLFCSLRFQSELYKYNQYRIKYNIPKSFKFGGLGNEIYGEGDLEIGENSYANLVWIQLSKGFKVTIGRNCRIAHNVKIYTESVVADQDLDFDPWGKKKGLIKNGNVNIGNGVWIGANVFINPNINIGNNVVIGANSVVTNDIPDNTIVGGVPAKVIKYKSIYYE